MHFSSDPDLRYRLPLFPLPTVLLPRALMPLHIFEPRYRQMVRDRLEADRRFGMVYHDWDRQGPFLSEPGRIGCVGEILEHKRLEDGRSLIVVEGRERFRIEDGIESDALYFEGLVTPYPDTTVMEGEELRSRRRESIRLFRDVVSSLSERPDSLPDLEPDRELSFLLAQTIRSDPRWHQRLLELQDEGSRLARVDTLLRAVLD
ncbi:MAG: LON peptidase substrate-binding domain-containing protein [Longimicrobiales bacterium]|nr:LON peptidase substrate-binding domain-containing protein [Longimicrobiales bacterium]